MFKKAKKRLPGPEVIRLLNRISESATDGKSSVGEMIRLCMRLAAKIGNEELLSWARSEAGGYKNDENLPEYRIINAHVLGNFFGYGGSRLTNAPIPKFLIDTDHISNLFSIRLLQPIAELEKLGASMTNEDNMLRMPWNGNAIAYYQRKEMFEGMVLGSAAKVIDRTLLHGVAESVRTRVLDFVISIEAELNLGAGTLQAPEYIESPSNKTVTQIFHTTIYGNAANVAVANSADVHQSVDMIQPGDFASLRSYLTSQGLAAVQIDELEKAVGEDEKQGKRPGAAVQEWLWRMMRKAGEGGGSVVTNASGSLLAEAIMKYFGLS
ncbi:hypothetical protein JNJ66_06105 [Candidatus Saccharibacteria bacterium]|nr:hypothetical protein [Candidatus Saccharibacteria bacterium]